MKSFPMKTLIWAIVVLIACFMLRSSLASFISNVQEFQCCDGVIVNVKNKDVSLFVEKIEEREKRIESLKNNVSALNQSNIKLKDQLQLIKNDLASCHSAQERATVISNKIDNTLLMNTEVLADLKELSKDAFKPILDASEVKIRK